MSAKHKNMLEAFRSADQPDEPSDTVPVTAVPPPSSEPSLAHDRRELRERVELERVPFPSWLGWIAAVILAFAAGVFVGRGDAGTAQPTDEDDLAEAEFEEQSAGIVHAADRPGRDRATENARPRPRGSDELGVAALLDLQNQYTVVVATYAATQEDLALATFDFLLDEGIPAFVPYRVGDKLVVLAGAEAKKPSLDSLRRKIHALEYGGKRGIFDDAYTTSIDSLVDR